MRFNKTFREGNWLIPQDNTHSPIDVVDAAIRDINGDNVPDLIVADESGVLLYLNDSEGQMVYTSGFYTATPRAIGVVDLNTNGLFDIIVATTHGVRIYNAEDYMDYVMSWLIDYNLDLHTFGARYYTADFPRFISPDPVSGNPMNPISWNRYLYCRNDPVNYFDPDGEDFIFLLGGKHGAAISGPVDGKWRYDSYGKGKNGHRHGVYEFDSLQITMEFAYQNNYTDYARWSTTPKENEQLWEEADRWHSGEGKDYKKKKGYELPTNNCGDLVQSMAEAINLKTFISFPGFTFPKILFEKNKAGADLGYGSVREFLDAATGNESDELQ
jgi:RHS repeat-associated protein